MSGDKHGKQAVVSDEGEGDLGLQGLHLESSSPRDVRSPDSSSGKGYKMHVIRSRLASPPRMNRSHSSFDSTSYFSAREDDVSNIQASSSSPSSARSSKERLSPIADCSGRLQKSAANSAELLVSPEGQGKKRSSKLRTDLLLPGAQRLKIKSEGSSGHSTASPGTSSPGLSATESKRRSKNRISSGTGDLGGSSAKDESRSLTDGLPSTGLLLSSPSASSFSSLSPSSFSPSVRIPNRRASLSMDKAKAKRHTSSSAEAPTDTPGRQSLKGLFGVKDTIPSHATPAPAKTPESSLMMDSDMQRWVLSVGCVNFDLEKGPDLEFLYPSLGISREERDNIAFSSFPDTSIFDDGQAVFSWRVREVPLDSSGSEAPIIANAAQTTPDRQSRSSTLPTSASKKGAPARLWSFDRGFTASRTQSSEGCGDSEAMDRLDRSISPKTLGVKGSKRMERAGSSFTSSSSATEEGAVTDATLSTETETKEDVVTSSASAISPLLRGKSRSSNYIHGYCYFRQRRDASIRRGYFQKSVVILSHLPYVSLFSEIVKQLGPQFFSVGMPALEAFSQDVQRWPPPEPGARMHLPLMGSVLSVDLPYHSQVQTSPAAEARVIQNPNTPGKARSGLQVVPDSGIGRDSDAEPILASIPSTPLIDTFRESLDDLWLLWECMLLADPILVVGPDPKICSEAVWHMLDLIRPIPFAGDFRPFFTIHDYDFQTLVTKNKPSAGVILGVTNPFMLQACKHWPHVFKVGRAAPKSHGKTSSATRRGGNGSNGSTQRMTASPSTGGIAGGNSAGGGGPEHTPELLSKRKRRISKDRPLLKKVHEMAEKGTDDEAANAMLRRYFSDLTERFLAPLNRYVSSLIPADFDLSSPTETPRIKPFNTTAFLASLKAHGTPLPIRSRNLPTGAAVRQSLYLDFIQCPNFSLWLHDRIAQSEEEQYNRKLKALESGNIFDFVSKKSELEMIDLYSRLKTEIDRIDDRLFAGKRMRELQPNSRWKTAKSPSPTSTSTTAASVTAPRLFQKDHCLATLLSISSSDSPPTHTTASKIEELVRTSGNSLTTGEKSLLIKKAHLIQQLSTLIGMLPADLRDTVQLRQTSAKVEREGQ